MQFHVKAVIIKLKLAVLKCDVIRDFIKSLKFGPSYKIFG